MAETPWQDKARALMARQDEAYSGPKGTWAQRWIPGACKHIETRCAHGDEIIHRRFRRQVCVTCGRSLDRPLPVMCWFTGSPHPSTSPPPASSGGSD